MLLYYNSVDKLKILGQGTVKDKTVLSLGEIWFLIALRVEILTILETQTLLANQKRYKTAKIKFQMIQLLFPVYNYLL